MAFTKVLPAGISSATNLVIDSINSAGVVTATGIVASTGTFSGNVNIAGVLTYEDVTSVDSVGVITARDGIHVTANSPGILFRDTNSGSTESKVEGLSGHLYYTTDNVNRDHIFSATGGSESLRITGDGNIGIGTDDPDSTLSIRSSGANGISLQKDSGNQLLSSRIFLGSSSGSASIFNNTGSIVFHTGAIIGNTSGDEKLRITSSGNIGIGTINPQGVLHLLASDAKLIIQDSDSSGNSGTPRIQFQDSTGAPAHGEIGYVGTGDSDLSIINKENANIQFHTNNTERLRITSTGAVGIGSDFTAIETAGGGGITLDSGGGGGNIGVFLKATGYTGNQTKLWQDSANAVSYLESTERPLIIKAGDGTGDYIRMDVAGSERLNIDDEGSIIHKTSSAVDNTEGSNSANSNYHARGASFNKIVSVNNGTTAAGQCMNMISHTRYLTMDGSDHNMIMIGNREGCFIGHIYAGYSTGSDGAVAMYKFHTFYGARTLTAEISPQSRSSDTISVDMVSGSSGDQHVIRVNGNGYTGEVTVGVVFLSASRTGDTHFSVRYY